MHSTPDLLRRSRYCSIRLTLAEFETGESRQAWEQALLAPDQGGDALPSDIAVAATPGQQQFLTFMLKLVRTVLQQAKVPVFSDLFPVSLQKDEATADVYVLRLQLPIIDFISSDVVPRVLEAAVRVTGALAGLSPTDSNREKIFAVLKDKIITPLYSKVPGGKSTIPVLHAASRRGIPFLHLGAGIYQLGWGSKAKRMDRSSSGADSYCGVRLAQSKLHTANLLRIAGFPAPVHEEVTSEQEAIAAAGRLGYPLVVKPLSLDRGEGVTVDIRDDAALVAAYKHACTAAGHKNALVERQVEGVCHRLFIADGKLLYAVARMPMSITADGSSTIALLVAREVQNQQLRAPWLRTEIKPLDQEALEVLAARGYTPESVPQAGTVVPLRRIESTADGGVDIDVTTTLHPDNAALAIAAARLAGLQMAGIDIMSADISQPWHRNGAIITEINFSPLLGGGAISRAAIPHFLERFIDGDGRIPVEACADRAAAMAQQAEKLAQGLRCYATGANWALDPQGQPLVIPLNDLAGRLQALIYRSDVDAIVYCA